MQRTETWIGDVCARDPLSRLRERELAVQWADDGDAEARRILIEANLRFVLQEARRIKADGIPLEDLFSVGVEALIQAVESFDPSRGVKVISYAARPVRWAMWSHVKEMQRPVATRSREERRTDDKSFDYRFSDGPGEGRELGELMADPDAMSAGDVLAEVDREALEYALRKLRERDAKIVRLYYGLAGDDSHTHEEIGNLLGISRQRVREIKLQALDKLRGSLAPS